MFFHIIHFKCVVFGHRTTLLTTYRFPERLPYSSFHTLTSRCYPFRTSERAQMPGTELLRAFAPERRHVLHVETWLLCFLLWSAAHRSASLAEQRCAGPCPAVRSGRALPCAAVLLCVAVPCCVVLRAVPYFVFVHARSHSTQ